LSFKPLGELNYKNLPQPVRTFAIAKVAGLGVLRGLHTCRAKYGPPNKRRCFSAVWLNSAELGNKRSAV
jgi:hypothetical protein